MSLFDEYEQRYGNAPPPPPPQAQAPMGAAQGAAIDDPERGAGFWPLWKASWQDSPESRMNTFSQYRPGAEYKIDDATGQIAYRDPKTGEWYLEEPSDLGSTVKGMLASSFGGGLPAEVGTAVGSLMGGPLSAMLGASAGEGLKQGVQALVDPNERSVMEAGGHTALAGGMAALGEGLGYLGGKALARKPDLLFDPSRAQALTNLSRQYKVPLTPAEITGNRELLALQSLLHDSPRTGDAVEEFLQGRVGSIDDSITKFLREQISPYTSPDRAELASATAAQRAREALVNQRAQAARPHYDRAMQDTSDVSGTINELTAAIEGYPSRSGIAKRLQHVRDLLTETAEDGSVAPITSVEKLHGAKVEIDDMIESAKRTGDNNLARLLTDTKQSLLGDIERNSPAYQAGRMTYAEQSQPINEFDASAVGQFAEDPQSAVSKMGKRLFSGNTPLHEIAYARDQISSQQPAAWNALVSGHLRRTFNELSESANGSVQNLGGMFRKKVFGNKRQREQMRAALGDEKYGRLEDLMRVMEATGMGIRGQSMTEPRQQFRKQIERAANPFWAKLTSPYDWFNEGIREKNLDQLYRGLEKVVMSDSTSPNFSIDAALRTIKKYQGRVPPERSGPIMAVINTLLQAGAQSSPL